MEAISALLTLCEGNSPVEFPSQSSVTQSFDIFFDLRLNKRLSKHNRDAGDLRRHGAHLWRHCNVQQCSWPCRMKMLLSHICCQMIKRKIQCGTVIARSISFKIFKKNRSHSSPIRARYLVCSNSDLDSVSFTIVMHSMLCYIRPIYNGTQLYVLRFVKHIQRNNGWITRKAREKPQLWVEQQWAQKKICVRSRRCGCLVTWFCYHLITKQPHLRDLIHICLFDGKLTI